MEDSLFIRNHLVAFTSALQAEEASGELPSGLALMNSLFDFIRMQDVYFLRQLFRNPPSKKLRKSLYFTRFADYEAVQGRSMASMLIDLYCRATPDIPSLNSLHALFHRLGGLLDLDHTEATLDALQEELESRLEHNQSTLGRLLELVKGLTSHGIFKASTLRSPLLRRIISMLTDEEERTRLDEAAATAAIGVLGNVCNTNIHFESTGA